MRAMAKMIGVSPTSWSNGTPAEDKVKARQVIGGNDDLRRGRGRVSTDVSHQRHRDLAALGMMTADDVRLPAGKKVTDVMT